MGFNPNWPMIIWITALIWVPAFYAISKFAPVCP